MQERDEKTRNNAAKPGDTPEALPEEHKKKKKKEDRKDEAVEALEKKLTEREEAARKAQDSLLYLQADFENFKRLKAKEREDTLKYGNEVLIKELLPVIDNLERALGHAAQTEEARSITEGVELTLNQFLKVLEKAGVTAVEAVGKRFDPTVHEAFFQEERQDAEPDTVLSEYQKGYLLNGRLLRPAVVVIAKQPEPA
jgi:molecular chaperone GrpE